MTDEHWYTSGDGLDVASGDAYNPPAPFRIVVLADEDGAVEYAGDLPDFVREACAITYSDYDEAQIAAASLGDDERWPGDAENGTGWPCIGSDLVSPCVVDADGYTADDCISYGVRVVGRQPSGNSGEFITSR